MVEVEGRRSELQLSLAVLRSQPSSPSGTEQEQNAKKLSFRSHCRHQVWCGANQMTRVKPLGHFVMVFSLCEAAESSRQSS